MPSKYLFISVYDNIILYSFTTTMNYEPVITQGIQSQMHRTDSNRRYHQLKECFEQISAIASQETEENYKKIYQFLNTAKNAMYENKFIEMYDKVFDYQLSELDILFERDVREETIEDEITSKAVCSKENQEFVKNKPPFKLIACKNPVGRPH